MSIEFFSCVSFLTVLTVQIDVGTSSTMGMEGDFSPFLVCVEAVSSMGATSLQNDLMVTISVDATGKAGVLVIT